MNPHLAAAILAVTAATAVAAEVDTRPVPPEVVSIGQVVPLLDRPIPVNADALTSRHSLFGNAPLSSSNLQAATSQIGAVVGNNIPNVGHSISAVIAPAGPSVTLGNVVGGSPPR